MTRTQQQLCYVGKQNDSYTTLGLVGPCFLSSVYHVPYPWKMTTRLPKTGEKKACMTKMLPGDVGFFLVNIYTHPSH